MAVSKAALSLTVASALGVVVVVVADIATVLSRNLVLRSVKEWPEPLYFMSKGIYNIDSAKKGEHFAPF
jgi:hypothetical protein